MKTADIAQRLLDIENEQSALDDERHTLQRQLVAAVEQSGIRWHEDEDVRVGEYVIERSMCVPFRIRVLPTIDPNLESPGLATNRG